MVHQQPEHVESSIGNVSHNAALLDGGAIFSSARLGDIQGLQNSGPTKLHDVEFTGLGTGLWESRNIKSDNGKPEINVNFDNIPMKESTGAFDRWPFKTGHEDTLHEKISDKVKEGMNPQDRTELDKEEKAYDKAMKSWSMMAGIGIKPPELDDFPMLKQHMQKVQEVEKGITRQVMDGLTPQEKQKLEHESDPLGSGFAPRPMTDEVTKRIRAATRKYLEPNK